MKTARQSGKYMKKFIFRFDDALYQKNFYSLLRKERKREGEKKNYIFTYKGLHYHRYCSGIMIIVLRYISPSGVPRKRERETQGILLLS